MKALSSIIIMLGSMTASAIVADGGRGEIVYRRDQVQVIMSCDTADGLRRDWYVLGNLNYGEVKLFTHMDGEFVLIENQRNLTGYDVNFYTINTGFLTFSFQLHNRQKPWLMIKNRNGVHVATHVCRDYLN